MRKTIYQVNKKTGQKKIIKRDRAVSWLEQQFTDGEIMLEQLQYGSLSQLNCGSYYYLMME